MFGIFMWELHLGHEGNKTRQESETRAYLGSVVLDALHVSLEPALSRVFILCHSFSDTGPEVRHRAALPENPV